MPKNIYRIGDRNHESAPKVQAKAVPAKSHNFLYVPVAFSLLALSILFGPAMASDDEKSFRGCPYLQQLHRVIEMQPSRPDQSMRLIQVNGMQQIQSSNPPSDKIVQF